MLKVNFGCGLDAEPGWLNFDSSPVLRLQRIPIFGQIIAKTVKPAYPKNVCFGDILTGLPLKTSSVDYVYCSHVLEHLSFYDAAKALQEVYRILKPDGVFRGVLPDLEFYISNYTSSKSPDRAYKFMKSTLLGKPTSSHSLRGRCSQIFSAPNHLWMWDYQSLNAILLDSGFASIRRAYYNDSSYSHIYNFVEMKDRWDDCLGFECKKL